MNKIIEKGSTKSDSIKHQKLKFIHQSQINTDINRIQENPERIGIYQQNGEYDVREYQNTAFKVIKYSKQEWKRHNTHESIVILVKED